MDERKNRERSSKLNEYMEHDAEIRRATNVRNALGPQDEESEKGRPEEREEGREREQTR